MQNASEFFSASMNIAFILYQKEWFFLKIWIAFLSLFSGEKKNILKTMEYQNNNKKIKCLEKNTILWNWKCLTALDFWWFLNDSSRMFNAA